MPTRPSILTLCILLPFLAACTATPKADALQSVGPAPSPIEIPKAKTENPPDSFDAEMLRLSAVTGRDQAIEGYKHLVAKYPNDPRRAQAMYKIAATYWSIHDPAHGIKQDIPQGLEWLKKADAAATPGSPIWFTTHFTLANWNPRLDLAYSKKLLDEIDAQPTADSLIHARVLYGRQEIAVEEHDYATAEKYCRRVLSSYNDPANIPSDPRRKNDFDCLLFEVSRRMAIVLEASALPEAEKSRRIDKLENDYPWLFQQQIMERIQQGIPFSPPNDFPPPLASTTQCPKADRLQSVSSSTAPSTQPALFSPPRERTLKNPTTDRTSAYINLVTGDIVPLPRELALANHRAIMEWARKEKIDAVAVTSSESLGERGLIGFDLHVAHVPDALWDKATPDALLRPVAHAEFNAMRFHDPPDSQSVLTVNTVSTSLNQPRTYAFRTRDNHLGILQFLEINDEPHGYIKFRYKLATQFPPATQPATAPSPN